MQVNHQRLRKARVFEFRSFLSVSLECVCGFLFFHSVLCLLQHIIEDFARHHREGHEMLRHLRKKINGSSALVTSQAKNCRALQFAKLQNRYRNTCATFGVYEKVDERDATARYQVTPVDTKWVRHKHSVRGGAHSIQVTARGTRVQKWRPSRLVCGSVQNKYDPSKRTTSKHFQSCTSTCHVHTITQKLRDWCWCVCQWRT